MSRQVEFESTVCNGFPVRVRCTIQNAEPEVGIFKTFGEDFEIMTLAGKPAPFIETKMAQADWDKLQEDCFYA